MGRRSRYTRRILIAGLALAVVLLLGCSQLGYYSQSVIGGARILLERRPIEKMLEDESTDAELRAQLETVLDILEFGERELGLPDNGSYRSFVEIDRPYVLWNVVATPEFSTAPVRWCFLIAGCVSYRGYFSEQRAQRFAHKLDRKGYDVAVGGVTAYSTLGWFADPVLSTFLGGAPANLAALLFHELAHQRVYVKGDTTFNESFATTVAEEGLRRWLEAGGREQELAAWRVAEARRQQFTALVLATQERLEQAFAAGESATWMAARKRELFDELRADYQELRHEWGDVPTYDAWFEHELNNADLAGFGEYRTHVPALTALLAQQGGDLERFYAEVERLAAAEPEARARELEALSPSA